MPQHNTGFGDNIMNASGLPLLEHNLEPIRLEAEALLSRPCRIVPIDESCGS